MPRDPEHELRLLIADELAARRPRPAATSARSTSREHRAAAQARQATTQYRSRSTQPIGRTGPGGGDGYIHC